MRLLLDTQMVIWALAFPDLLSSRQRHAIVDPANDVVVSAASLWEIAIKVAIGKLEFPIEETAGRLAAAGMSNLPIAIEHALAAGALPRHHTDPFDRMLIAQAQLEGLILVTTDRQFSRYGVPLLE